MTGCLALAEGLTCLVSYCRLSRVVAACFDHGLVHGTCSGRGAISRLSQALQGGCSLSIGRVEVEDAAVAGRLLRGVRYQASQQGPFFLQAI